MLTKGLDPQGATIEDIQWQGAIVVLVAMEEVTLLVTVQRRIGGIEVQNQSAGGLVVGGHNWIKH